MTHSGLTDRIQITSESSPRLRGIDRFIIHHAATTSLENILALFQPGGRSVSANYAMGNDGTLVLAVDEDRRAWTSSSAEWDGRAVTIEVANSAIGDPWPVSNEAFHKLARLIADVAARYNFPINDDTILTHQELYTRYGASYATACPGDLQRRKGELLALANHYRFGGTPISTPKGSNEMYLLRDLNGTIWLYTPNGRVGIGSPAHVEIIQRMFNSYPNYVNFNAAETDIVFSYIKQASQNDDAEFKAVMESLGKITIDEDAIIAAIETALEDVTVDASLSSADVAAIAKAVIAAEAAALSNG